ncbi:MAG TPA: hypothetical protein VJ901_13235 [Thermoanaerobaculia bacterium]|nr:hypothetical protein [Thermoanaerobaculia bacterium]
MSAKRDDLLDLIRRGRRSTVESRRELLTSSRLMHERDRLRYTNSALFRDIADLSREFVIQVEQRKKAHPEENQS